MHILSRREMLGKFSKLVGAKGKYTIRLSKTRVYQVSDMPLVTLSLSCQSVIHMSPANVQRLRIIRNFNCSCSTEEATDNSYDNPTLCSFDRSIWQLRNLEW